MPLDNLVDAAAHIEVLLADMIEFTLDDEDAYENEDEGLLASADEVATKLDLARAYLDMEDPDGARITHLLPVSAARERPVKVA